MNINNINNVNPSLITLIKEVRKRPALWNKHDDNYNNRIVLNQEWDNVAMILNKDKDFVKHKWRNLRDQFQRELKKLEAPPNAVGSFMAYYKGKWTYFKDLLFLHVYGFDMKEQKHSKVLIGSEHEEQTFENITREVKEENFDYEEELSTSDQNFNISIIGQVEHQIERELEQIEAEEANCHDVVERADRKRKAQEREDINTSASHSKRVVNQQESSDVDEDLHFVKSIVPFMRKLDPIRKLVIRNEIQTILLRELICVHCKNNKPKSMCICPK